MHPPFISLSVSKVKRMEKKKTRKKGLIEVLQELADNTKELASEQKRMRGVWERASTPKTKEKEEVKKK